jgi:hypothetical protein
MRVAKSIAKARFLSAVIVVASLLAFAASAHAAPVWEIRANANPTTQPGEQLRYSVVSRNVGNAPAPTYPINPGVDKKLGTADDVVEKGNSENCTPGAPSPAVAGNCYTVTATFPEGLIPVATSDEEFEPGGWVSCEILASTVTCSYTSHSFGVIMPNAQRDNFLIVAEASPSAVGKTLTASFQVSGAGAGSDSTVAVTRVEDHPAEFGIAAFDGFASRVDGGPFTQAGGHPYDLSTSIAFNSYNNPINGESLWPVEPVKNVVTELPPGLLGNPTVVGQCTTGELANGFSTEAKPLCAPGSQVGTVRLRFSASAAGNFAQLEPLPVFNMVPSVGSAARFGFNVMGTIVVLQGELRSYSDYGLSIVSRDVSQGLAFQGADFTFWGSPADEAHRPERSCPGSAAASTPGRGNCAAAIATKAFLRLPTSCTKSGEGLPWRLKADSYFNPGSLDQNGEPDMNDPDWDAATYVSHEAPGFPAAPEDWGVQRGTENCPDVPVKGTLDAKPTSIDTETSSGLEVNIEVPNLGLENPAGIASSDLKEVKVFLPEGMTINPSQADGLGVCSPAQYESTVLSFFPTPGKGCPDDAKIGSVLVKTPLLEETIPGDVYVAKPFDNPFGSLLALYVVLREPERGVLVKMAGKVETDERTGQITTTFDDLPQQPFSSFDFKFREGARAPLVTPQACGTYTTQAEFTGWSSVDPETGQVDPADIVHSSSDFQIVRGIGGGPCPTGGLPPFKPGLIAGSLNNAAGKFSPFNVRLFRTDAEQEITHFSIKLPPGISGKLAGVPFCPDAAIEASKARSGEQELASPSCPKASEIGHSLAGAGVGSALVYAPGKIYLAGPYNGSALSIAAITAAKVGPFDLGTVVVRQALKVDPETAEVFIDATGSDPIPHIIDGVTVHLRDIRAYVDKPEFTLNPTSCERTSTSSTLLGSGLDFFSDIDDRPVTVSTPYQAADCAALGFKPGLKLQLKGGTKRAGHPALKATLKMKPGMANIARAQVTLPKSEFLDQSHIGTVCTRVQYAKDQCPAKSVYGYATAFTPILDEPLAGPVYLRSSSHKLPDLVAGLKSGKIEIDLAGRIDSVDGQIRSTFETVPDAPVSKFVLTMQGGKKGLLENSTNLCARPHKAIVEFDGQNGKTSDSNPVVKPQCKGKKKRKAAKRRSAR